MHMRSLVFHQNIFGISSILTDHVCNCKRYIIPSLTTTIHKVEKASVLLKQLIESFGVLSSEQEETIGTSVAQVCLVIGCIWFGYIRCSTFLVLCIKMGAYSKMFSSLA